VETLNLVVARYQDGKVVKGSTRDFSPLRPTFHVEVAGSTEVLEIRTKQLKALFFVRTFGGNATREDLRGFVDGPEEVAQGKKIAVRFKDGEFICGYTLSWTPEREGFFLFPADTESNNERIYVVSAAAAEIKAGMNADALALKLLAGAATRPPSKVSPRPSGLAPRPPKTDAA
jgi:hypothetical protein